MHIPVFGPHGNQASNPGFAAVALMPLTWKEGPTLADIFSFQQIQAHSIKFMLIQSNLFKFMQIHANSCKFKQIQANSSKVKQSQANSGKFN